MRYLLLGLIRVYQLFLSWDHSFWGRHLPVRVCRFYPSCSEYAYQAVKKYGWRGVFLAIKRVSRCHPFAKGGYDPLE